MRTAEVLIPQWSAPVASAGYVHSQPAALTVRLQSRCLRMPH